MVDRDSVSPIHAACRERDHVVLGDILDRDDVDINIRDKNSTTPVMLAALEGFKDVFDILVNKGCDLSKVAENNSSVISFACTGGNVEIVSFLLDKDPTWVNRRGHLGKTPVLIAAKNGHEEVFRLLVSRGADLSLTDRKAKTTLHWACSGGAKMIIQDLLQQDTCDINARTMNGMTPVMLAARKGHIPIFYMLVKEGCDLSLLDENNYSVLHHATRSGKVEIVDYLLNINEIEVNAKGRHGFTPLMIAAKRAHGDVFYLLLSKQCDIPENANEVLHLACVGGCTRIIEHLLVQCEADVNARTPGGATAVMLAALSAHKDAFDQLVSQGAWISSAIIDENQDNTLHAACKGGNVDIVDDLLSLNIDLLKMKGKFEFTPLMLAAEKGHRDVFFILLTKECDLSGTSEFGDSLLHSACIGGNMEIVEYVLNKSSVDMNTRGQRGLTALMIAAQLAYVEIFFSLADKGCDVTLVDKNRDNLLHHACYGGHVEIVDYVVALDIFDLNGYGQQGLTPMMMAVHKGHSQVFDLLEKKCSVTALSKYQLNILHVASMAGSLEIVEKLLLMNCMNVTSRAGEFGRTALMLAAVKGHTAVFDCLVSKGCDLTAVDKVNNNILHFAATGGNVDIVEYVLSKNITNINSSGQYLRTPVMIAAECNKREVFNYLVSKDCDLSLVDQFNNNILHSACIGGDINIVKYVLSKNIVSINSRGQDGKTAVRIACDNDHEDIVALLTSSGFSEQTCNIS